MTTVRLTRVVTFSAAHRYYRPEWSVARNREVFGACANEHGHGHNYECHVTIVGSLDGQTGMVMNLRDLDRLLREEISDRLDHRFLNHAVPEFAPGQQIPTSEEVAVYVWRRLEPRMPAGVTLVRVRIQEDQFLYAEVGRDGSEAA
jgi:6-pyruvoyltetrahydropterin/6-carboxytetrahydropterin synthase